MEEKIWGECKIITCQIADEKLKFVCERFDKYFIEDFIVKFSLSDLVEFKD